MESLLSMTQMVSGSLGSTVWSVKLPAEWASAQLAVTTVEEQIALAAVGVPARCPSDTASCILTVPNPPSSWVAIVSRGMPEKRLLLAMQRGAARGLACVSQDRGGAEQGELCAAQPRRWRPGS